MILNWIRKDPFIRLPFAILVTFLSLIALFVTLFIFAIASDDITRPPRPYFSLNDQNATYTFKKTEEGFFTINYLNENRNDEVFKIPLKFTTLFINDDGDERYEIFSGTNEGARRESSRAYVGNSKVDLEDLTDVPVRVKGSFRDEFTRTQCILDKCMTKNINMVVVDIESVERI